MYWVGRVANSLYISGHSIGFFSSVHKKTIYASMILLKLKKLVQIIVIVIKVILQFTVNAANVLIWLFWAIDIYYLSS